MKKYVKDTKGITLIALVITIIVLLILAGVTINMVLNGGLLTRAQDAATETRGATVEERAEMWKLEWAMLEYSTGTATSLEDFLQELEDQKLLTHEEVEWILNEEENPDKLLEIGSRSGDRAISFKVNGSGGGGGTTIADMFDETGLVAGKVHVGDYVSYSPDATGSYLVDGSKSTSSPGNGTADHTHTRESLQWRVLDVKGDQVRLISATPTSDTITLQGANGYNNAVKLIDETCAIYGGTKGTAQGLKIEDIEEHTLYDYTTYTNYGSTYTPSNKNYPLIFAQENKQLGNGATGHLGLSQQDTWYNSTTTAGTLNTTYTYWYKSYSSGSASTEWEDSMYYTLFINNGSNYPTYWMSSRCVLAGSAIATFIVRRVSGGYVDACNLYISSGGAISSAYGVRPVVTLNSGIQITGGDGTTGWTIE